MLISIYDEDDTSSDDHVDDVYIEEIIYPKQTISNVLLHHNDVIIVTMVSIYKTSSYDWEESQVQFVFSL